MKRKLISYDAFNQIESKSLTHAAYELTEAESLVSKLLETGPVKLHCLDATNVVYESADGTYVRADYRISEGKVSLTNIEQIVIDEASLNESIKSTLRDLVESLANEDDARAESQFAKYLEMMSPKMRFGGGRREKTACEKAASNARGNMSEDVSVDDRDVVDNKKSEAAKKGHHKNPFARAKAANTRRSHKDKIDSAHKSPSWKKAKEAVKRLHKGGSRNARIKPQRFGEWAVVINGVLDYVETMEVAPSLSEATVERNDRGDVTAVTLPTSQLRAEGKILDYKYKGLKTDVKVLREQALLLAHDEAFQAAVSEVKRHNNLSDNDALEESMSNLIANFPVVLYLTQEELAKVIGEALSNRGVGNFDDTTCTFMAEGILRTAFEAYPERAEKIVFLAGASIREAQDGYIAFQDVVKTFFNRVDEAFHVEMRVFADLRDVFVELHEAASEIGWKGLCEQVVGYITQLESVLNGEVKPNLTLAEQAAAFISVLLETNLESQEWKVVKQPYTTMVGEHPDMAKKASHGYAPSKDFSGDWTDPAPALDDEGGKYKSGGANKIRNHSWGNIGGKDTYPSLNNPTVPKAGDYTIKGEKGVDKGTEDGLGQWGSSDTVPNLDNPYVPKSVKKHVNNDNRVDDVEAKL